ncbi:MAG: PBECR2 nuclease fold domain-containing protein [Clostridium sp.]
MSVKYKEYKRVGQLGISLCMDIGFPFYGVVYASPGVLNHIKRKHGKQLSKKVKENLICTIEKIIECPDYIGIREGEVPTLELIKKIDATLLLGLKVDEEKNYIYVTTLYPITEGKINQRLYSGKLVEYDEEIYVKKKKRKKGA